MQRLLTIFMTVTLAVVLSGCAPLRYHLRMMRDHGLLDHLRMHHGMMDHDMMDHGMMGQPQDGVSNKDGQMDHGMMDHGTIPAAVAPFDVQFIDSMITHHEGAIAMANIVLEKSERPELLTLAEAITDAQSKEIEQLKEWRTAWYPDLPQSKGMGMAMGQMMIADDDSLPFDQRFLMAMINHHEGALHMAEMALEQAEHPEIKELSNAIISAQKAEIEEMQGWLEEWF